MIPQENREIISINGKTPEIDEAWDTAGIVDGTGWETPLSQEIKAAEKKAMPIAVTVPKTAIPGNLVYFAIKVTCKCEGFADCNTKICDGITSYDSEQLIIKVG